MMRAIRRLPPAFVLATGLQLLFVALELVQFSAERISVQAHPRWILASTGVWFATIALLAAGAFEIARRLPARQAGAARFAGGVFCCGLVLLLVFRVVRYLVAYHYRDLHMHAFLLEAYASSALVIGGFGALLIASRGFRDSPMLASLAALSLVVWRVPPHGVDALGAVFGQSATQYVIRFMAVPAVMLTMMTVARAVDQGELEESADLCERGLRRAAAALWLRVLISVSLAMNAVRLDARGPGGITFHQYAMVAGLVVGIVVLVGIAFGAFATARSGVRDFSSYALHIAGALLLWVAGAMVSQLPEVLGSSGSIISSSGRLATFPLALPLVSAVGTVIIAIAIARFANRRGLVELGAQSSRRAGGFVALSLTSMVLTTYGLPNVTTTGQLIAVSFGIAIATVLAAVVMAKLFALAADAVRDAGGLPSATARTAA